MNLRKARTKDIPALGALIDASIRGLGREFYDATQVERSLLHLFGVDSTLIDDGTYFLIEVGHEIVACGGWSWRRTPFGGDRVVGGIRDEGQRVAGTDAAVIRAFYVHPDWTRRGFGRTLLDACEDAARNHGFDRFELTSTQMGKLLYRACGYREVEPEPITLPDGTVIHNTRMVKP